MKRQEKLLLELPDFILGKTPEPISREIQQLIETNPNFRAEYEALQKVIGQVESFSETVFERAPKPDVPAFYFETLAERVRRRVAAPRPSFWERCVEVFQMLLHTEQRYQLVGALAGAIMAFLMILATSHLDMHLVQQANNASQGHSDLHTSSISLVSAMQYAESLSPELLIGNLSEEEAMRVIEAISLDVTKEEKFKTLSEEEVKILMQLL
jgi:hypothetical protein